MYLFICILKTSLKVADTCHCKLCIDSGHTTTDYAAAPEDEKLQLSV